MGCGWYRDGLLPGRGAHRPALGRRPRRRAGPRDRPTGWGRPASGPGIIGEIGTDKPWVSPARGARPPGGGAGARRTGLAITTHARPVAVGPRPAPDLRGGGRRPGAGRHRPRRLVPGPRPLPRDHRARREPRVRLPRDAFTPTERHGEGRVVELLLRAARRAATPTAILLSQDVCHDSQLTPLRGQRLHLPGRRRSCRACAPRACRDAEIETMTVDEPAAAPDDRLAGTDAGSGARRQPSSVASTLSVDVALERDADRAAVRGRLGGGHESLGVDTRARRRGRSARSTRPASRPPACRTSRRPRRRAARAACRPGASAPENAIAKHEAWAAATSSSGLVLPSGDLGPRGPANRQVAERAARDGGDGAGSRSGDRPFQVASARRMAAMRTPSGVSGLGFGGAQMVPHRARMRVRARAVAVGSGSRTVRCGGRDHRVHRESGPVCPFRSERCGRDHPVHAIPRPPPCPARPRPGPRSPASCRCHRRCGRRGARPARPSRPPERTGLDLTNQRRTAAGLVTLQLDPRLYGARPRAGRVHGDGPSCSATRSRTGPTSST